MIKAVLELDPRGIYTGSQAIAALGIERKKFYRMVKNGEIPYYRRVFDDRNVFKGSDLLKIFTALLPMTLAQIGK